MNNEPFPTSLPNGERPTTTEANTSDANENEADYIITTDCPNDVNDAAHSRDERIESDVSNTNETTEATKNEISDWPDSVVYHKNPENFLPDLSLKRGDDIIVPEISQNDDRNKNLSPRGGRYNLRPNPNPNYSEDFRY